MELLREKAEEIESLSDYYDEIFNSTSEGNVPVAKEKMKYIRAQILKKTFEAKNILKRIQLAEKPRS